MTSPEWEAANEDDSDRFPQTSQESGQNSTESAQQGSPAPVDPMRSEAARVARYAEAIYEAGAYCGECGYTGMEDCEQCRAHCESLARAVVAVADEEHAALVAEVARLRKLLADHAEDAYEDVAEWGAYASDYFTEKWNLSACLTKWGRRRDLNRAALADAPAEQRAEGGA